MTSHLAEQNAKQADKCSAFQKVTPHFVNQIDFQIFQPFLLKEVTEEAGKARKVGQPQPSDGSGVVLTRAQEDPSWRRPNLGQPVGDPSPALWPRKSPLNSPPGTGAPGWLPSK